MKRKLYFIAALASMSLTNSFAQFTTSIPNLEAYYPLDGNILDSSANNYDLGTNTTITYGSDRFGNTNKSITSNSSTRLYKAPMSDFAECTFAFWVHPLTATPSKQVLLSRTVYILDNNTANMIGKGGIFELYAVAIDADSMTLNMSIHFGQSAQPTYTWEDMYTATKKIAIGDWSHVGVTYSSASNTVKMYVNGEDAGTGAFSTPTNGQNSMVFASTNINGYNTIGDMILGGTTAAYWNGSSISYVAAYLPFEGRLDDFYIFSRAITPTEMETVKNLQDPSTAGINENTADLWTIYPNPATDQLTIRLASDQSTSYSLFGTDNREVLQGTLLSGNNLIDIQSVAAGTYFLRATINGTAVTRKIVKH